MTWREPVKLFVPAVDDPQVNIGKPDEPVAGFGFGNTNRLADQRLAEKNHGAAPTSRTRCHDGSHEQKDEGA